MLKGESEGDWVTFAGLRGCWYRARCCWRRVMTTEAACASARLSNWRTTAFQTTLSSLR